MSLNAIARELVAGGKGILAVDESVATCNKRFAAHGIEGTEAMRRAYRELLLCTPGLERFISGAILYDETLRQRTAGGLPFVTALEERGILPGIKVDTGLVPLAFTAGEQVTQGLDGLRERIAEYSTLGARFTKWRAVFAVSDVLPSARAIRANVHALARYAALVQEGGLVPVVEPEVLMDGSHSLAASRNAHDRVLAALFEELELLGVRFEGTILKCSMVLPGGASSTEPATIERVASATIGVLQRRVPPSVAGIAFLSGGQSDERATRHLDAMNRRGTTKIRPWPLTFSYGRALQQAALARWSGRDENVDAARAELLARAAANAAAARGEYAVLAAAG